MLSLRKSHPSLEKNFSVSKWLKHQILLDEDEIHQWIALLDSAHLVNVSEVGPYENLEISKRDFLSHYCDYIRALKQGSIFHHPASRRYFSVAIAVDPSLLYTIEIQPGRFMVKTQCPLIQLQQHAFRFSESLQTIHPMVLSPESITWGFQISYPQLFHENSKSSFSKIDERAEFPNTALFRRMVRWMREVSVPTTFTWQKVTIPTAIRLGKQCLNWIQHHPQLRAQGIHVHVY